MSLGSSLNPKQPVMLGLQAQATQAYSRQSRGADQDRRIVDHLPMVKHIVHKVASQLSHVQDLEDLISAGTVGLVKAAQAFDPCRDTEFKTYAYIRIRGAVLDELRSRSPVSPKVIKQMTLLRRAHNRLMSRLGHVPDDQQLADEAGISREQLHRTLAEGRRQHFLSIHGMSDEESPLSALSPVDKGPSPVESAERAELKKALAQGLMQLPQRDRQVMILYYRDELTMKEIAQVLKVTEARVSQIHAAAIFRLSSWMQQDQVEQT